VGWWVGGLAGNVVSLAISISRFHGRSAHSWVKKGTGAIHAIEVIEENLHDDRDTINLALAQARFG
jgi:hypothetical protein